MSKKNIRKIKCSGNCMKKGDLTLHPTGLYILQNENENNKLCPINNYIENLESVKICFENPSIEVLTNHMRVPDINIQGDNLLLFYKITNIDSLIKWIDQHLEETIFTINRVLNLWIKENLQQLKNLIQS